MIDATTVYVLIVIFLATLIRSTLGFGEALVAVPLLALRIPVLVAAPLAVMVSVTVAAVVLAQDWSSVHIRSVAWLVPASLFGIPFGLLLLLKIDNKYVKVILGFVIACFAIYLLTAKSLGHLKTDHRRWLLGVGFLAGVLGGAYGINGPPLVVYAALRRWSPQHLRATFQGYFFPVSLAVLIAYAAMGLWAAPVTRYFIFSLPGMFIAIVIGRHLNRRLRGELFYRCVYLGLIFTGGMLILQGLK